MTSRYIPDWMSSELFIDWMEVISLSMHYLKNMSLVFRGYLFVCWLDTFLWLGFRYVSWYCESEPM